jgi:hypothetical protein
MGRVNLQKNSSSPRKHKVNETANASCFSHDCAYLILIKYHKYIDQPEKHLQFKQAQISENGSGTQKTAWLRNHMVTLPSYVFRQTTLTKTNKAVKCRDPLDYTARHTNDKVVGNHVCAHSKAIAPCKFLNFVSQHQQSKVYNQNGIQLAMAPNTTSSCPVKIQVTAMAASSPSPPRHGGT